MTVVEWIVFIFLPLIKTNAALSSGTQRAMFQKSCGESGTECLIAKFPLPALIQGQHEASFEFHIFPLQRRVNRDNLVIRYS